MTEMGSKLDRNRPCSVENFYAKCLQMWITPQKPDKTGILPPIPVDNCVDSVDFFRRNTVNIHRPAFTVVSRCYRLWGYMECKYCEPPDTAVFWGRKLTGDVTISSTIGTNRQHLDYDIYIFFNSIQKCIIIMYISAIYCLGRAEYDIVYIRFNLRQGGFNP